MKIAVLNGSPKGSMSITLRYVKYMELKNPGHIFDVINIAAEINKIQKNEDYFRIIIEKIAGADAVLWAFPLYVMLVPAQYKRFIELVFEAQAVPAFKGKYAASLSTSVHFMDNIAHNYIHAISEDLGMMFFDSHSPHMNDLMDENERENLTKFSSLFLNAIEKRPAVQPSFALPKINSFSYVSKKPVKKVNAKDLKVHIVTDEKKADSNLSVMIKRLSSSFKENTKITRIDDIGMKGGCLGCCQCAFENECIYKDGFCEWYLNELLSADIIIFAGRIRDRFLSSDFKQLFDRSFFLGHTPKMKGKTIGYMVSGSLSDNQTLQEFFSAFTDCGMLGFGKAISDECTDSAELDDIIDSFAAEISEYAISRYISPPTFYAVGGHKIFRDMIWGGMKAIFRADHRYYKKNKLYDFPQYNLKNRFECFLMRLFMSVPQVRRVVKPNMQEHMAKPLDEVLARIKN